MKKLEKFECLEKYDYEQIVFVQDKSSGLKAIINIHDTTLGPALGGTRMWHYKDEDEALLDGLRLSRGMTYKNAAMGLNLGGGKAVIIGDARKDKSEELFRTFGRYVDSLNGRYITAEDVGINTEDMQLVNQETDHVCGLPGLSGDPSPFTAYGTYCGMKAAAKRAYGSDSLKGKKVAVQGVGHVGYYMVKHLAEEGVEVVVADLYEDNIKRVVNEFGVEVVAPEEIYDVSCDIFAPTALGGIINDQTLERLDCDIIAGSANNQLKEPENHGKKIELMDIIYAPDYVINGGGVINAAEEVFAASYNAKTSKRKVEKIYDKIQRVFEISDRDGIPTYKAADVMAEERINKMSNLNNLYRPKK
ncbi:Glu/Leu/Phe/Val family dehydrogenase [Natroniella sp. ANB-PHB2]|uniref:Glu/Leu/Phe/Val family dehydrogenase n=1 Tax=Natroniella sp. ANB-PHB2 TaxID=3384444 RepID=UPI0038D3CFAF